MHQRPNACSAHAANFGKGRVLFHDRKIYTSNINECGTFAPGSKPRLSPFARTSFTTYWRFSPEISMMFREFTFCLGIFIFEARTCLEIEKPASAKSHICNRRLDNFPWLCNRERTFLTYSNGWTASCMIKRPDTQTKHHPRRPPFSREEIT